MLSLEDRASAVIEEAWGLLPPCKHEAWISTIVLADIGAKHGGYQPDTGQVTLNTRLFWGSDAYELLYIDINGDYPARCEPYCSRALHTTLHELAHAIGRSTGIDEDPGWLALSAWERTGEDRHTTRRYVEDRPGWEPHGPSEWRYKHGTWFPRPYSSKSPHECMSDCIAHIALGWHSSVTNPNGRAKFRFLQRELWGIREPARLQAAAQRWRHVLHSVGTEG
ncbi:MAG TPA: hypothetical protein VI542_12350 [Candidatus Tectomicrobia bacterium]